MIKTNNISGFTLIELIVVMTIMGIIFAIGSSFLYGIQISKEKRLTLIEVENFNSFLNNAPIFDLYLDHFYETDKYEELNMINNNDFIDLYYSMHSISPVVVNKFDYPLVPILQSDIHTYGEDIVDLVIGLQLCNYIFHKDFENIDGNIYKKECEDPFIGDETIYLQGFVLNNSNNLLFEKSNYQFNSDNYYGYLFNLYDGDISIIEDGIASSELLGPDYIYFDLFSSDINEFYNLRFEFFKFKKLNGEVGSSIFIGTESEFVDMVYNFYIPGVIKDTVIDPSDLEYDLNSRKNFHSSSFNNVNFFYNNPSDFSNSKREILNISNK